MLLKSYFFLINFSMVSWKIVKGGEVKQKVGLDIEVKFWRVWEEFRFLKQRFEYFR